MSSSTSDVEYFEPFAAVGYFSTNAAKRQIDLDRLNDIPKLLSVLFVHANLRLGVHAHAVQVMSLAALVLPRARDGEQAEAVAACHACHVRLMFVHPFETPRTTLREYLIARSTRFEKFRLALFNDIIRVILYVALFCFFSFRFVLHTHTKSYLARPDECIPRRRGVL